MSSLKTEDSTGVRYWDFSQLSYWLFILMEGDQGKITLVLFYLPFLLQSAVESCIHRSQIHVVEGEPFYLKPCGISAPVHRNETATMRWFKGSASHEYRELNNRSSPRVTFHDHTLEFWPVEMEDEGTYISQVGWVSQFVLTYFLRLLTLTQKIKYTFVSSW